jgi:hypothetical protein
MRVRLVSLLLPAILICGCAARSTFPTRSSRGEARFAELIDRQKQELTSFAALLRVKMSRNGKIDDFRAEVFSEGTRRLSLYARGFLGKSAFKAVLIDDSIQVFFPSEGAYFVGLRSDLETGDLRDSRHIIDYVLALCEGGATIPDTSVWQVFIDGEKRTIALDLRDRQHQFDIKTRLVSDGSRFPFLRLESVNLASQDGGLRANLSAQSAHFNRNIPAAKFELDVPASARALSRDEVVELLTGTRRQ